MSNLVQSVFVNSGFELGGNHRCDGAGGDADIVLKHSLPVISDCTDSAFFCTSQDKNRRSYTMPHTRTNVKIQKWGAKINLS